MNNENLTLIENQLTKTQQADMAETIISKIESGDINPLAVQVGLSAIENVIKTVKASELYKDSTLVEAEKYDSKTFNCYGAQLQIKEVGVKYDFTKCEDPIWNELNDKMEIIKASMKEREDILKRIPYSGQTMVDEDSGEVYKVYPPLKTSTTSVTTTFKK